jgi:hypothetical protein|tara:strand:+ start:921 stop:1217 length:297 start_codon:yes stop_codon:yes gene_type:complete
MSNLMTNDAKLQEFIVKATGRTIGRNTKQSLATLFANSYAEYVKAFKQLKQGYALYKEQEGIIDKIKEEIKDLDTIPTSVITTIIEAKPKKKNDEDIK